MCGGKYTDNNKLFQNLSNASRFGFNRLGDERGGTAGSRLQIEMFICELVNS
jgi:hypothetical protein